MTYSCSKHGELPTEWCPKCGAFVNKPYNYIHEVDRIEKANVLLINEYINNRINKLENFIYEKIDTFEKRIDKLEERLHG